MRIFLTGATGFIGSHLLQALGDHELLCLTRDTARLTERQGVHTVRGDLSQPDSWSSELERFRPDCCVHLAWEGLPDYSLAKCRVNLIAGLGLIEAAARARVGRVIVAGSCWEYGQAEGAAEESQPNTGCGVFASTKNALRMLLESATREARFEYRWARIFFVYGRGQRPDSLIPHARARLAAGEVPDIREPGAVQDFVHVDDVAQALAAITEADAPSGVYNVGTGRPIPVAQVVNRIAALHGVRAPYPADQTGRGFWADTTKTSRMIGWSARISIEDGLATTLGLRSC